MSPWSRVRPAVPGATRVALVAGAAAGLVWMGGTHRPALDLVSVGGEEQPEPVSGTSLATSVAAICPGNELTGISGVPDVTVEGTLAAVSGPVELLPQPAVGEGEARLTSDDEVLATLDPERPAQVSATLPGSGPVLFTASGSMAPALAATQEWALAEDDARGLTTTPCLGAGSDLWLMAGGDGAGRQERLALLNPGGNPVTADVSVHGEGGPVGEVRTETVAPGGRTTLLLDAWAGDEQRPAVHVVADGGGLQAVLAETWITGSTPRGAETVVPSDEPSTDQVVPGALLGGRATVRVAVPGDEQAVVRVSILGADGLVPATGESVITVDSGATGELALPSVAEGAYAVRVRSDVPVLAAVVTDAGTGTDPGDIAWATSAPAVADTAGAALPAREDVTRTLHLVSTGGSASAEVRTVVGNGVRSRTVDIDADTTTSVDLANATAVWVQHATGAGEVRGAIVSTTGEGAGQLVSVMTLEPSAVTSPVSRAFPLP
jgi:hypothetical protein